MDRAPFNRLAMATDLTKCAKCRELQCSCRDDEWKGLPRCDDERACACTDPHASDPYSDTPKETTR